MSMFDLGCQEVRDNKNNMAIMRVCQAYFTNSFWVTLVTNLSFGLFAFFKLKASDQGNEVAALRLDCCASKEKMECKVKTLVGVYGFPNNQLNSQADIF